MPNRKTAGRRIQAEAERFSDALLDAEERCFSAMAALFEGRADPLAKRLERSRAPLTDGFLAGYAVELTDVLLDTSVPVWELLEEGTELAMDGVGRELDVAAGVLPARHRWRAASAIATVDEGRWLVVGLTRWTTALGEVRQDSMETLRRQVGLDTSQVFTRPGGAWWRALGDCQARARGLVIGVTDGQRSQAIASFNADV